jgi:hypothetical protein
VSALVAFLVPPPTSMRFAWVDAGAVERPVSLGLRFGAVSELGIMRRGPWPVRETSD